MSTRSLLIALFISISAGGLLGGCSEVATSTDLTTQPNAGDPSADDAPMFLEPLLVDGSAKGLEMKEKLNATIGTLPIPASRTMTVSVHIDALNADHRKEGFVIKKGVKKFISWCIGTQYTLTLFGGHLIVVESTSVQEAGGFWTLNGDIVKGGEGTVRITVDDATGTVVGRIVLESEHRDFYIVPVNAGPAHVLYEPVYQVADKEYETFDVESDPLKELQRQKASLEETLADPALSDEARKGYQYLLDGVNKLIEEATSTKATGDSPEAPTESKPDEGLTSSVHNQAASQSSSTIRVLTLKGTQASNPQDIHNAIVSELGEVFQTNSQTNAAFEFANSSPIAVIIPSESSLTRCAIRNGAKNGQYSTSGGVTTQQLRNQYIADIVMVIAQNQITSDCGCADIGQITGNDTLAYAVVSTVCLLNQRYPNPHEVAHLLGAGHENGPGLFSTSRAYIGQGSSGQYGTVTMSGLTSGFSIKYLSQEEPPPPPVVPLGDSQHDNREAVNALASTVAAYRNPSIFPPNAPLLLDIQPEFCQGVNTAFWATSAGANFYELRKSVPVSGNKILVYSGPLTNVKFTVTTNSYMWVRACNAQGCSGYTQGDQLALYWTQPCE